MVLKVRFTSCKQGLTEMLIEIELFLYCFKLNVLDSVSASNPV
jgi:hypothetical protein